MKKHRTTDYASKPVCYGHDYTCSVGIVCVLLSDFVLLLGLVVWFSNFTTDNVGVTTAAIWSTTSSSYIATPGALQNLHKSQENRIFSFTYWLCDMWDVTIQCLLTLTLYLFYISTLPYPTAIIYLHFCTSAGSIVSFQKFKTGLSTNFSNVP